MSVRLGQFTVIDAEAPTDGAFEAEAVAVFGYDLQLANEVALEMATDVDALGARSPNDQVNAFDSIEQPGF